MPTMKRTARAAGLSLFLLVLVSSCRTGVAAGQDPVLVDAEKVEESAFYLTNAFVELEKGTPVVAEKLPGVHAAAERIRNTAPGAIRSLHAQIEAYRSSTGGQPKPDLRPAIVFADQMLREALSWISQASAAGVAPAKTILKDKRAATVTLHTSALPFPVDGGSIPFVLGAIDFAGLLALLRVLGTSGGDLAADYSVLRTLYEEVKSLWAKDSAATPEQRAALAAEEEAAFAGPAWQPDPTPTPDPAPPTDPSK